MASGFAHAMREAELHKAIDLLPPGCRILELGAGDGWQSRALAEQGFDVVAVDVDPSRIGPNPAFPVALYNGKSLPYESGSFDVVYSSNVMEHIGNFPMMQGELARVLVDGGVAVHCVPTAVWRLWTTLGHPIHAVRSLPSLMRTPDRRHALTSTQAGKSHGWFGKLANLIRIGMVAPRHGEYGSFLGEHVLFSVASWRRRFEETGWTVARVEPTRLFYTGNELFGLRMSARTRQALAALFGSSTVVFLIRPPASR